MHISNRHHTPWKCIARSAGYGRSKTLWHHLSSVASFCMRPCLVDGQEQSSTSDHSLLWINTSHPPRAFTWWYHQFSCPYHDVWWLKKRKRSFQNFQNHNLLLTLWSAEHEMHPWPVKVSGVKTLSTASFDLLNFMTTSCLLFCCSWLNYSHL